MKQFLSLRSYFLSEDETQARFKRLQKIFKNPMTEVHLLFLQAVLPTFKRVNQFLQREEPLIHVVQPQLLNPLKSILGKFLKPSVLADGLKNGGLSSVNYKDPTTHVHDDNLAVGFTTKQRINLLLSCGEISEY